MESQNSESQPGPLPAPDAVTAGDAAGAPTPTADPTTPAAPPEPAPTGIVLGRDLIFTAKVRGTAAELGYRMLVAGDVGLARMRMQKWRPRVVFIDLTAGDLASPAALAAYRQITGSGTWFVAVGPHVQADVLDAARTAGCQVVLPRSKFAAELPALMRRYFSRPADQPDPGVPTA
jgi:hypothetical protein